MQMYCPRCGDLFELATMVLVEDKDKDYYVCKPCSKKSEAL